MHLVKVNTIIKVYNNLNTIIMHVYVVNVFSCFGVVDFISELIFITIVIVYAFVGEKSLFCSDVLGISLSL